MPEPRSDMPRLVFGLGATKAGTSWLYRYLDAHPDCMMPTPKELHYFDRADGKFDVDQRPALEAKLDRLPAEGARARSMRAYFDLLSQPDLSDAAYKHFVRKLGGEKPVFGDMTPAYSLVSTDMLKRMVGIAAQTRFVFVMRDPVARLWSNIRMMAKRRAAKTGGTPEKIAAQVAQSYLDGGAEQVAIRSDYKGMLERMSRAIPGTQLFTAFYERLFTGETISKLCAFLGIRDVPGAFEKEIHKGQKMPLSVELHSALRAKLAPQYAAVAAQFNDLPNEWRANMGGT
ncbi:MAG: sulfotransferase [Litoreibacter sp.]|nr:sulfotransferase [Litoreibacter sp.]MCY4337042.1 sulfotransferase [Litoreibacter sp.]